MSKTTVSYAKEKKASPLSFWVHKPVENGIPWLQASKYDPPLPAAIVGRGYPVYKIEYRGHELIFISAAEIMHCMEVLSHKVLPSTFELANASGYADYQHTHWLATWPGEIKSWKDRQEIIRHLEALLELA